MNYRIFYSLLLKRAKMHIFNSEIPKNMGSRAPEPIPGGDQCVTPIPAPPTKISGNPQIHNFSYMPDSL